MRIKYRKIIPQIVLILLLLWFFTPELIFVFSITRNRIASSCIIPALQNNRCDLTEIKLSREKSFDVNLDPENPQFTFTVNRNPDSINRSASYVELIASKNAVNEDSKTNFNTFLFPQKIDKIKLTDSSVSFTKNSGKTEVTLNYSKNFNIGYTIISYIKIEDKSGRAGYSWIYNSTAKNISNFLIGNYAYLLQYLLWYAAIFGASLKSSTWATVYNSHSKEPILGAVVRIFKDSSLLGSFVTGQTGVLYTKLQKGRYKLLITHPQFSFPSKLAPLSSDGEYKNLYYGGDIVIKKDNSRLNINIPLDPVGNEIKSNIFKKVSMSVYSTIETFNPPIVLGFAALQIALWPAWLESWVFGFIGALLTSLQILQKKKSKETPGILLDEQGSRLANFKINLYDAQWQRLVDSKITNESGEYEFIVPNSNYYLVSGSEEYQIQGGDQLGRYSLPLLNTGSKARYINEKLVLIKRAATPQI